MSAGKLKHRITLQSRTRTKDDAGGYSVIWADTTSVWAGITTSQSREARIAGVVDAPTTFTFKIRSGTAVDSSMRITYRGKTLNIRGVNGDLEDPVWTYITAELDVPA